MEQPARAMPLPLPRLRRRAARRIQLTVRATLFRGGRRATIAPPHHVDQFEQPAQGRILWRDPGRASGTKLTAARNPAR